MTVHVLHAGDGYTYLTRQVASGDHQRRRGEALTDYYTAAGNPPGRWVGTGLAAMGVDGAVREDQMKALFGEGLHPDAEALIQEALGRGVDRQDAVAAVRLGRRFPSIDQSHEVWRDRLNAAYAEFETAHGYRPERGPERDLVRWNVAHQLFLESHQREPRDDAELKTFFTQVAKPPRQPVAGVDLVFTPVKSVSILWALGDNQVRRDVELAHEAAWRRAFSYVEIHAARTRTGAAGVAQIDTHGLVAAAFDHPDSRTGDPNLHTHVAVSAKVQGVDGKWRSLDMRVLHAMAVSASETYNTAIEDELRTRLGVEFVERPGGRKRRPVREIKGLPDALLKAFSSRRAEIEGGYQAALEEYRATHGHDAPRHVQYKLAQEATLANRPTKDHPRSWAQARQTWLDQAAEVLRTNPFGGQPDVEAMIRGVLGHGKQPTDSQADTVDIADLARQAIENVAEARSTWTQWHVQAEVQRLTRAVVIAPDQRDDLVAAITTKALSSQSLQISAPDLNPTPDALQRRDGESVYTVHGTTRYTSERLILAVEDRLLAANAAHTGSATTTAVLSAAKTRLESLHGWTFDTAQVELARSFVCDDRLLVAGVGPAGTGKTTAMQLTAAALDLDGRRLVAVAPSARAAAVLGQEIGVPATTIAKVLHAHEQAAATGAPVPQSWALRPGDMILVDETGMAGTPALGRILALAKQSGALVRLLGDPMQLTAVEAGGALRLLAHAGPTAELDRVHRFVDPAEAEATLRLRAGHLSALGFYEAAGRLADGSREAMIDEIYHGWSADLAAGRVSLMVSASTAEVAALSARARRDRVVAGAVESDGVVLHDGNQAGVGDLIVTRENQRAVTVCSGRDFVKNGDIWHVTRRHTNGDLTARHQGHGGSVRLAAAYVAANVELAYATTVHRAQGMTVDAAHVLVDKTMTRESLYVALSRGRASNRAYVVTDEALDIDLHVPPGPALDALDVLRTVLARESSEHSATETISETLEAAESLATLVPQYLDAFARAVITDDLEASVRAGLRDAGGRDLEDRVSASPAWRQLVVACAGDEPRALVAEAVRSRLLDGDDPAQDPAAVLAWRVPRLVDGDAEYGDGARNVFHPPWLPGPSRVMGDSPVGRWGIQQDRLIAGRVGALVEQVAADPPTWAAGIRPRPEPGAGRDRWEADVGVVVAYRDQFRITDDADPLGAARVHGFQLQARLTARAAWQRVEHHFHVPDHSPATANERLRALATSGRRDPIEAGEALRRLKAAQRLGASERPYERARHGPSERGPRL
jgi:conjugative relaxase-like TrwC/TraI family protein